MTHLEQEHNDHVAGSASEHQNCLTEANMTLFQRNGAVRAKVDRLTDLGQFPVVSSAPAYCHATDAILGDQLSIVKIFSARPAADAEVRRLNDFESCDGEVSFEVFPRLPRTLVKDHTGWAYVNDDDCPF